LKQGIGQLEALSFVGVGIEEHQRAGETRIVRGVPPFSFGETFSGVSKLEVQPKRPKFKPAYGLRVSEENG
jgi:hypothetical protein